MTIILRFLRSLSSPLAAPVPDPLHQRTLLLRCSCGVAVTRMIDFRDFEVYWDAWTIKHHGASHLLNALEVSQ